MVEQPHDHDKKFFDSTKIGFHTTSLDDLTPAIRDKAKKFVANCSVAGVSVLVYCTYRDEWEQAKLYRVNRCLTDIKIKADKLKDRGFPNLAHILLSTPPQPGENGNVLTNAGPGESAHQHRLAFDFVPMFGGKPVWGCDDPHEQQLWGTAKSIATEVGLQSLSWERPHLQLINFHNNLQVWMDGLYAKVRDFLPKPGQNPFHNGV